ncbi:MAG: condensation domain-containing protein, partial [Thermodesulfobacteriota bacterium]|nr:condensation domain-containing protein [Thermodesulfobacteriota bacterium]
IQGIDLSCIKAWLNGSEPISATTTRDFINKFRPHGFDRRSMSLVYGMAESSLQITCPPAYKEPVFHCIDSDVLFGEKIALPTKSVEDSIEIADVGYPVAGVDIRIVDDNDDLLHENMVGHIQIKGAPVVSGYVNNEEANRELFCNEWLRTGDMGFITRSRLVITGRLKDIIFVNGQNIYAHDIEDVVKRVPGMTFREFAVSGLRQAGKDNEEVFLFVKGSESSSALASMLKRVNETLVSSMGIMIGRIVSVPEIPRTPSAKIQRFKLRQAYESGMFDSIVGMDDVDGLIHKDISDGGELTETEQRVVDIWRAVLGVDEIRKTDNFFELGGNSLRATKAVSRIRNEFSVDLPLKAVFEFQTVESLAGKIEKIKTSGIKAVLPPIERLPAQEYYELSNAQKRLWVLDKVVPNSPFYNIPGAVLIENMSMELSILEKALQAVVDRHETLRTTFLTIDEKPVQRIAASLELQMPVIDLSDEDDEDEKLKVILESEKRTPFNLEQGPLFRTQVVKLSDTRHAFVITMHHIIADGWSMGVLVQDAVSNYLAFLGGKPAPSPELRIQYKDFAAWQADLFQNDAIKKQKAFWLEMLAGELSVLNLPIDHPRPAVQTQHGATQRILLDKELAHRVKEFARDHDVTRFILTLAIFKILLHKLSGQDDIIVGSPIAGRNHADIEPMIGFFVNVLPMRSDLSGNPNFSDFLDQVKQTALDAYANQDYPFDKLVEVLNPVRDLSRSPIFDVVFEFREASSNPFTDVSQGDFSVSEITGDDPMARFDLVVTADETDQGIKIRFEYNADLFESETITQIMGYYRSLVEQVIHDPDILLADLDILDSGQRQRILETFNATDLDMPLEKNLHLVFGEMATKYPQRPAIIFGDQEITYADLDQKTNQLAQFLVKKGIGEQDRVGILTKRGPELIIAQLATWKAGGAFVPIDPDYPGERIRFLLDDAQAKVLLTQQALLEIVPETASHVVTLDQDWPEIARESSENFDQRVDADSLAYVIYTSGSTGRPKGAMISHANLLNMVFWHIQTHGVDEYDRASQVAGVAFDAAVWEIWPYLLSGACVVPLETTLSQILPEDIIKWFDEKQITRTFIPTKLAEVIMGMDLPELSLKT